MSNSKRIADRNTFNGDPQGSRVKNKGSKDTQGKPSPRTTMAETSAFISGKVSGKALRYGAVRELTKQEMVRKHDTQMSLGAGAFGEALLVRRNSGLAEEPLRLMKIATLESKQDEELAEREIEALRRLDYPHVVKLFFYTLHKEEVRGGKREMLLVMEHCGGGDLCMLMESTEYLAEELVQRYMAQVYRGLAYMHTMGVVHRDIKPENIMLSTPDPLTAVVKIIDFGLALCLDKPDALTQASGMWGTAEYAAPEIHREKPHGAKCDVWSAGIVAFQLLHKKFPFSGNTGEKFTHQVCEGTLHIPKKGFFDFKSQDRSKDSEEFLKRVLKKNPDDRLSARGAFNDDWLVNSGPKSLRHENVETLKGWMEAFHNSSSFVRLSLVLFVTQKSSVELAKVQELFSKLDLNGDGYIDEADLKCLHDSNALGGDDWDVLQDLINADVCAQGAVDVSEFAAMCMKDSLDTNFTAISRQIFEMYDENRDGVTTMQEVCSVLRRFGLLQDHGPLEGELLRTLGIDPLTEVNLEEFRRLLLNKRRSTLDAMSPRARLDFQNARAVPDPDSGSFMSMVSNMCLCCRVNYS